MTSFDKGWIFGVLLGALLEHWSPSASWDSLIVWWVLACGFYFLLDRFAAKVTS